MLCEERWIHLLTYVREDDAILRDEWLDRGDLHQTRDAKQSGDKCSVCYFDFTKILLRIASFCKCSDEALCCSRREANHDTVAYNVTCLLPDPLGGGTSSDC